MIQTKFRLKCRVSFDVQEASILLSDMQQKCKQIWIRRGDLEILTFIIFTCFQFFVLLFRNPDIWDDVFNFDVFVASNDSRITAGVEVEEEALLLDPQMF